jgi:hypothetical protein
MTLGARELLRMRVRARVLGRESEVAYYTTDHTRPPPGPTPVARPHAASAAAGPADMGCRVRLSGACARVV